MAKVLYCWRCKMDIPMLEEHEWEQVLPPGHQGIEEMERYRRSHGCSVAGAKDAVYGKGALARYFEITGFRETDIGALWHHRLSLYGPACRVCGKPLRTPRARWCVACGALR